MPKVLSYEDKKYDRKKAIYDVVIQIVEDLKYEGNSMHGWNRPAQEAQGLTAKLIGNDNLELIYHRYEVTTVEGLARGERDGYIFLDNVVKEIKKRFKKYTKKTLKLQKVQESQAIDKVSRIQSDTSWMLGSSRYGYGQRPVGRYLLRDRCVYSMDCDLLEQ